MSVCPARLQVEHVTVESAVKFLLNLIVVEDEESVANLKSQNSLLVHTKAAVRAAAEAKDRGVEIKIYTIIYQAIDEIKAAMEGLLAPSFEEVITSNIEIRDVFKITKIGTVAGCYVLDGTVKRAHKIRVIRDFVVVHDGEISALKRFKDDVAEVKFGYECGLSVKNFNDLEVGDMLECYEMKEVKRTLK